MQPLKPKGVFPLNVLKAPRTVESAHETLPLLFVLHNTEMAAEGGHLLGLGQPLDRQMDSGMDELNVTVFCL